MAFNFKKHLSFIKARQAPIVKERNVVGIDIGSSSIKVVQLRYTGKTATLVTYGELQLGPYAGIELGQITSLSEQKVTQALVDVVRESSVTTKAGVLAIPYTSSFMTVINVTAPPGEEVGPRIPVEARKYIPVPIKEITLDWFLISSAETDTEVEHTVLLAALHNDSLAKFNHIITGASMVEIASEIEVFSTIRAAMVPADKLVAVVDLGAAATRVYIISNGTVKQIHSIKNGGAALTEILTKEKNQSFLEAELLKREYGLALPVEATTPTKPTEAGVPNSAPVIGQSEFVKEVNRIGTEINHFLKRYERVYKESVPKIILTGGNATLNGLVDEFRGVFGSEVVLADPFAKVVYPSFMEDTLKQVGPSFTVAIGVALREMNSS